MATFADDTAILAVGREISSSTRRLQSACDTITEWTRVWRIKMNKAKSIYTGCPRKSVGAVNHIFCYVS
jgi:hypothetical protein